MADDIGLPFDANDVKPKDPTENLALKDFKVPLGKVIPSAGNSGIAPISTSSFRGKDSLETPQARLMEVKEILTDKDGNLLGLKGVELRYNGKDNTWVQDPYGDIWGYKNHANSYPSVLPLDPVAKFSVGDFCYVVPSTSDLRVWAALPTNKAVNYLAKILESNDITESESQICCTGFYSSVQVVTDLENCGYKVPTVPYCWGESNNFPALAKNLGKLKHKDGQDKIPANSIVQVTFYPDMEFLKLPKIEKAGKKDNSCWVFELTVERWFLLKKDNRDGSYKAIESFPTQVESTSEGCLSSLGTEKNTCFSDFIDSEITIYEVNNIYGLENRRVRGYLSTNKDNEPIWLFDVGGSATVWAELTDCGPHYSAKQLDGSFVWGGNCLISEINGIKDLKGTKVLVNITGNPDGAAYSFCELRYTKIVQKCFNDERGSNSNVDDFGVLLIKENNSEGCYTNPLVQAVRAIKTVSEASGLDLKIKTEGDCVIITLSGESGGEGGGSPGPKGDKGDKGDPGLLTCDNIKLSREKDELVLEINGQICSRIDLCCKDEGDSDDSDDTDDCCSPEIETNISSIPCGYEASTPCASVSFTNYAECPAEWDIDAPFTKDGDSIFYTGPIEEGGTIKGNIRYWAISCPDKIFYFPFEIPFDSCGEDEYVYRYVYCEDTPPETGSSTVEPPPPSTSYPKPCCDEAGKNKNPIVTVTENKGHPKQNEEVNKYRCCLIVDIEYDSRIKFNHKTRTHAREFTGKAAGEICTDFIIPGELKGKRNVSGTIEASKGRDIKGTAIVRDDGSGLVYATVPGYRTVTIPVPAQEGGNTVIENLNNSFVKGTIIGEVTEEKEGGPAEDPNVGELIVKDDCNQTWIATVIGGDGENNGESPSYKLKLTPNGRNKWKITLNKYWDNAGTPTLVIVNDTVLNLLISFVGECGATDTYNFISNVRPVPIRPKDGNNGGNGGGNGGGPAGTGGNGGGELPPPYTGIETTTSDGIPDENVASYYKITGLLVNEFVTYFSVDCNSEDVVWSIYNDRDEPQDYLYFELLPLPNNKARLVTNHPNRPPKGSYRIRVLASNSSGLGSPTLIQIDVDPSYISPIPKLLIGSYLT